MASTLLGCIVGLTLGSISEREYSAQSSVLVTSSSTTANDLSQASIFITNSVPTYAQLAMKPIVLNPVIASLNLDESAEALSRRVTAQHQTGTALITISVTDSDPAAAAEVANAVGQSLIAVVAQVAASPAAVPADPGAAPTPLSPIRLVLVQEATEPSRAQGASSVFFVLVGAVLGLALGVGGALIWERARRPLRSAEELAQATGVPVLGDIPSPPRGAHALVIPGPSSSGAAEAFRALRTVLLKRTESVPRVDVVISSDAREHRASSALAANLASAYAESGLEVVLLDAHLRGGHSDHFGLDADATAGLSDVLLGKATIEDVLQTTEVPHLWLLPAGASSDAASALLGLPAAREVITNLRRRFDMVVIDAPPLLATSDGAALAAEGDEVLLAVATRTARRDQVIRAVSLLQQVDAPVAGAVLTSFQPRTRLSLPMKVRGSRTWTSQGDTPGGSEEAAPPVLPLSALDDESARSSTRGLA